MAKPVQVRPLVSGGAIPANPLAYLEQLNRARSYQNAYIRAGWSNWKTSLASAEKQIEEEGQNYRKKLDYLAGLQEALTKASSDLAALTKERQKTLADLETVGFKAAEDRALEQAKLDAEAGKANADQRNKIYLAKLKEAGDTARLNAELQTKAAIATAEQTVGLITQMIGKPTIKDKSGKVIQQGTKPHPGFEEYVGATAMPFKRFIEGTDVAGFERYQLQVEGKAFLEAFEALKGGGAITEIEGAKGTQAIMRMNKAQSEKEYIKAARELQDIVNKGVERARAKAGGAPAESAAPTTAPAAAAQTPIYARNPSTGQRIMSIDGGATWSPAR